MTQPVKTTLAGSRNDVVKYSLVCCAFYIAFLLLMKALNAVEHSGFRIMNYLALLIVTFLQIKNKIRRSGKYVPFLQVFFTVVLTGTLSSFLFSIFLMVYGYFDPLLSSLLLKNAPSFFRSAPAVVLLFEGTGASIIIGLMNMVYFTRYEEGEEKPKAD